MTPVVVIVFYRNRDSIYYCIILCACIAEYRSSAESEAHYFVKSGHVFVENVENLYLLRICLRNIVSQVHIILYKPRDMWSICNRNYGIHRTLNIMSV